MRNFPQIEEIVEQKDEAIVKGRLAK